MATSSKRNEVNKVLKSGWENNDCIRLSILGKTIPFGCIFFSGQTESESLLNKIFIATRQELLHCYQFSTCESLPYLVVRKPNQ